MHFKIIMTSWVVLCVAALTLLRCATDPGSTTSTAGGGAFEYATGDFDLAVNKDSSGTIYVAEVLFTETNGVRLQADSVASNVSIAWTNPSNITISFVNPSGSGRSRPCDQTYQFVRLEIHETFVLYVFTTSSTCVPEVSATITITNTTTGESRTLGAEGTSTEGQGGSGSSGITYHTAFVTSGTTNGDIGTLSGADALCTSVASSGTATSSLGGTWKAILSSETISAASRLPLTSKELRNTNGAQVKSSALNLFNGDLSNKINYNQNGALIATGFVWTGSTSAGGAFSLKNCLSWTDNGVRAPSFGLYGQLNSTTSSWISSANTSCDQLYRIYCMNF